MRPLKDYFKSLPIDQQTDEVYALLEEILTEAEDEIVSTYDSGYADGLEASE